MSRHVDVILTPPLPADATARDHLWTGAPTISVTATLSEARRAAADSSDFHNVYVVDDARNLVGLLPLPSLFDGTEDERIEARIQPVKVTVRDDLDQEHVALTAIRHGVAEVPAVDADGRFVGIIPTSALLLVLQHEHVEDVDRLSGILRQTEHAARSLEEPPTRRVRERLPWLLVGLTGSAIATAVVVGFEKALEQRVTVAFFMPGIVYLADAIGTQTEVIAVRGLSFSHAVGLRSFFSEMRTGFLLGLALALPTFPGVWWAFGDARLALAVAIAILVAGTLATAVGLGFPVILSRFGKDPALGSGPLATVVQDVLSLVTYLVVADLVL
jgi:magnesium transporter